MTKFNRRNILKIAAISGMGLAAAPHSSKPALAAEGWTVNSPSEVSNESGSLSSLEISASGLSFSLDYNGLGSGSHSVDFQLEAKLSTDSSFESVFEESFSVEGDSGTVSESKLSTSFPVDLLASTSMSASDFEEPNTGDTEVTTVELRVSFSWSDGGVSASDSVSKQFDVSVKNDGPVTVASSSNWDSAVSQSGVVHESVANTDHNSSDILKQGYSVSNPYLSSNLVGYWPFQEDSGSTAYDFSGNNNHGSINKDSYMGAEGVFGTSSYQFNGGDNTVVTIGSNYPSGSSGDEITFTCWVYPDKVGASNSLTGNTDEWGIQIEDGSVYLRTWGGNDGGDSSSLSTGEWYFIAVSWVAGSHSSTYVGDESGNFSNTNNASISDTSSDTGEQRAIGARAQSGGYFTNHFEGKIADVRLYGRALSESEIKQIYDVFRTTGSLITGGESV